MEKPIECELPLRPWVDPRAELMRFNAERERIVRSMKVPPGEARIPLRFSGVGGDIAENAG